jgi:hypothetical protein
VRCAASSVNIRLSRLSDARAQLALLLGAFVAATLIAKAFGAGWGTASAFGQMAFAATLVAILLRAD